jgi:Rieske Fe-S protein
MERLGDPFFGIFLNPGHQIHLDEWVSSPIAPGSTAPLRSGMAFQVDVIPATGTDYFTTNIEDGVALACPCDGSRFDLETGEPVRGGAVDAVPRLAARVEDGWIEVMGP